MNEVESLARTMYWLEATINQGKEKSDWDKQDETTKVKWCGYAKSVICLARKE